MKRILVANIFILIFISCIYCQSDYGVPAWTRIWNTHAAYGHKQQGYSVLKDCLGYCEYVDTNCIAVDFDRNESIPTCWTHYSTETNLSDPNIIFPQDNVNLYEIKRNDSRFKTDSGVVIVWTALARSHSTGGSYDNSKYLPGINNLNYWTLFDCSIVCQYFAQPGKSQTPCVAIDFDITTEPPCWFHWDAEDLIPNNTYPNENCTQIRFKASTPSPVGPDTDLTISRCIGQSFVTNQPLCTDTSLVLRIVGSYYKINPFCCEVFAPDTVQPDVFSNSWELYPIDFFNSTYDQEIKAKCDASGCTDLTAESYTIENIENLYCDPENQTNAVVIVYRCQPSGYTESTVSTTTYVPPTRKVTLAQNESIREFPSTSLVPNSTSTITVQYSTSAITVQYQPVSDNNSTPLIIGLVVGLGGAAIILAIIIIIICCVLCTKKRKEEKVEAPPGNNPVYFTYTPEVDANPYSELPDNTAGSPNNAYAVYELNPNKSVLTENENNDKLSNRGTVILP